MFLTCYIKVVKAILSGYLYICYSRKNQLKMCNPVKSTAPRLTQHERSEAMRERLIEATLECLVNDGYAGTTISKIISTAKVSRGAPIHHFPSKAALMEATAEQLIKKIYISLGKIIKKMENSEDRLESLIMAGASLLKTPEASALLELLVASRHEPELAAKLQHLWIISYKTTRDAAEHYLASKSDIDNVGDLIILTQWVLRGMVEDMHITSHTAKTTEFFNRYIKLWSSLLSHHLYTKSDVTTPPPKPKYWD